MAKYATKSEPRSQSASGILSVCVKRRSNTDMATCALWRALIQVTGERDVCVLENTCILPLTNFSVCHVIMEMNIKITTVMITMMKVHIAKKNLRSRCCYVTSINAMITQSHKEVNHMKTCSLIGEKLAEQCYFTIYFGNLLTGSQNKETML